MLLLLLLLVVLSDGLDDSVCCWESCCCAFELIWSDVVASPFLSVVDVVIVDCSGVSAVASLSLLLSLVFIAVAEVTN